MHSLYLLMHAIEIILPNQQWIIMAKAYVKYSLIGAKSSERPSPLLNQLTVHYHDKGFCKISARFVKDSL